MGAAARPAGRRPAGQPLRSARGSLSLELALATPALFLLLLVAFHAAVFARDLLLVQHAARHGARVAATTTDDAVVHRAVSDALDGRGGQVEVRPPSRSPGVTVHVTVRLRSPAGTGTDVTGTAAAMVEPIVGEAAP